MDYDPNSVQAEAVANADAELNNVGLPNVHELAKQLKVCIWLYRSAASAGYPLAATLRDAELALARIEPHIATNI